MSEFDVGLDALEVGGMIHQRSLQSDTRISRRGDVVVESCRSDDLVLVETELKALGGIETILAQFGERRRVEVDLGQLRAVLLPG